MEVLGFFFVGFVEGGVGGGKKGRSGGELETSVQKSVDGEATEKKSREGEDAILAFSNIAY
jgi:hypothetical protein